MKLLRSLLDRYFRSFARKSDIDNLYTQLAALLEIRDVIAMPVGPLRGWSLSPDAMATILRDIQAREQPRVLEFGSGESTFVIAAALKRKGAGSLVSLEHESKFYGETESQLIRTGLNSVVDLRLVGMRTYEPQRGLPGFVSYDLTALDVPFDIAVIDGPVVTHSLCATRLAPLEWCVSQLNGEGVIYLDDAFRSVDRRVIEAIRMSNPQLEMTEIRTEKGLVKIQLSKPNDDTPHS